MKNENEDKSEKFWLMINAAARKAGKLESNWYVGEMQGAVNGVVIKMFQCELVTKGPRKGHPNYRTQSNMCTVVLTPEETQAIRAEVWG